MAPAAFGDANPLKAKRGTEPLSETTTKDILRQCANFCRFNQQALLRRGSSFPTQTDILYDHAVRPIGYLSRFAAAMRFRAAWLILRPLY